MIQSIDLTSIKNPLNIGLGTHLYVESPWPGDSKVTFSVFEKSCHLLLPV